MKGELGKKIDILKKQQVEMLEMKNSVNQIKDTVESFPNTLDQLKEEKIKGTEGRVCEILHSDTSKVKTKKNPKQT